MIGFDLLRPGLAALCLLALLVFALGARGRARARAELARWTHPRRSARFVPGCSPARGWLRMLAGALALLLLAVAALGPVRGYTYRAVSRKGLDLVLALDTSRSMLAQDLRPSRLERAKREIRGLLDRMGGDRVALVAFSGDARDVAPLTRDRGTLEGLLDYVTPEDNQLGGTNLAAAIEHALSLFDGRSGAHEAIVLLTDGEDLEGKGAELAEEARKRHIRVYVVGIGTEAGGKIPITGADGRETFLTDPDGNEVVTRLERASLETLARTTGGAYLSAEESPTPLEDLYRARLTRIEGRETEGGERRVPYDRFQWPLGLALVCLLIELGLRERRPTRGEREAHKAPAAAAALVPLALLGASDAFTYEGALSKTVRCQRSGELESAEQSVRALLQEADALGLDEGQRARAQYALGVVSTTRAERTEKDEEAEPLWTAALDAFGSARALAGPGELRQDATYDLGTLELLRAERLRAKIPEVSGQPAMPAAPAAPTGNQLGAGTPPPEDPPPRARERYLAARDWLVERLRADWKDEDVRADLELVQRRLHELDAIEEKRKQEQDQQKKSQDEDQQNKDQQNKDQQDKDQKDGEKPQDQNPPKDPQDQKGNENDKKPEDAEDQPKPDEKDGQPKPEDAQQEQPPPDAKEGQAGTPKEPPPAERLLTREEVMQILDRLAEIEREHAALEAAGRARRRAGVKRDW